MTRWLVVGTVLLALIGVVAGCGGRSTTPPDPMTQPTPDDIDRWVDEHRAALSERTAENVAELFSNVVGQAAETVIEGLLESECEPDETTAARKVANLASQAFADDVSDNSLDQLRRRLRAHEKQALTEWFAIATE